MSNPFADYADYVGSKLSGAKKAAANQLDNVSEVVSDTAGAVKDKIVDTASDVKSTVSSGISAATQATTACFAQTRNWKIKLNFAVTSGGPLPSRFVQVGGSKLKVTNRDYHRYFTWGMPVLGVGVNTHNDIFKKLRCPIGFVYNPEKSFDITTKETHNFMGFLGSVQFYVMSWAITPGVSVRQIESILGVVGMRSKWISKVVRKYKALTDKRGVGGNALFMHEGRHTHKLEWRPIDWMTSSGKGGDSSGVSTPVIGVRGLVATPNFGASGYKLIIEELTKQF